MHLGAYSPEDGGARYINRWEHKRWVLYWGEEACDHGEEDERDDKEHHSPIIEEPQGPVACGLVTQLLQTFRSPWGLDLDDSSLRFVNSGLQPMLDIFRQAL